MDEIKEWVAQMVRVRVTGQGSIPTQPGSVLAFEWSDVTPLITTLRVKTRGQGIRHFTVKVSENW